MSGESGEPPRRPPAAQLHLDLSLNPGATFASFYPAGNELALELAERMAAGRGEPQFLLYGVPESGKSHLLQAMCHAGARRGTHPAYLPLAALRDRSPGDVLEGLEGQALVCLDELDAVLGEARWEQELFGLFNRLRQRGVPLALAAQRSPRGADARLADLHSRLHWGPVLRLAPLRGEHLAAALHRRATALGLTLERQALDYLGSRGPRTPAALFGLLERLDAASLAEQRRPTVPFIRELLARADG